MSNRPPSLRIAPPSDEADRTWLAELWQAEWGGEAMVTRGRTHRMTDLAALIAWDGDERVGAATYWLNGAECELTSLNALASGRGIGTALLAAVEEAARAAGACGLCIITTNDNLDALRFYQRRGCRLAALYPGAVDESRRIKPSIPWVGNDGIPLHDEIELSKTL